MIRLCTGLAAGGLAGLIAVTGAQAQAVAAGTTSAAVVALVQIDGRPAGPGLPGRLDRRASDFGSQPPGAAPTIAEPPPRFAPANRPLRFERMALTPYGAGARFWSNAGWSRLESEVRAPARLYTAAGWNGAFSLMRNRGGFSAGGSLGYQSFKNDLGGGYDIDARGWTGALHLAYAAPGGGYLQGSVGYAPKVKLNRTRRPGVDGPTSAGVSRARVHGAAFQAGWNASGLVPGWKAGPFVAVDAVDVQMGDYVGWTPIRAGQGFGRADYSLGVEGFGRWGRVLPQMQLAYVHVEQVGDLDAVRAVAAVRHPMARRVRPVVVDGDHLLAAAALDGVMEGFAWRASVEGRFAEAADVRASFNLSRRF